MTYWTDFLLVGVPLIDSQHRKLVEAIGKLMAASQEGKGKEAIAHTLSFAVDYAKEHFRDEENLQERYAYPEINAHKRYHAHFIMSINALVAEFERTGPNQALTGKLNKTLVEWLINHISIEDKKLGRFISEITGK